MQIIELNNHTYMPAIGLGLWQVKKREECISAVTMSLAAGYRHFDTAQVYGNEAFLGEALVAANAAREDLFITTKIWNDNQSHGKLIPSFDASLHNLQTTYVDLLLLHFPVTETRRAAWKQMEAIMQAGQAKAIGVSNYTIVHLTELLQECSIVPAVNQVELHVYLQQPELLDFCRAHRIALEAYSPLAHGYGLDDPVLHAIGKKYNKSSAQVMLRWCLEKGTAPLPKSTHELRIQENIQIFDFMLDESDIRQLATLDKGYRTCWDPTDVQ